MATKTKKSVQYLRCSWKPEAVKGENLESRLKENYQAKNTVSQRTFPHYDGEVIGANFNDPKQYFFGVLTFQVPEGKMPIQVIKPNESKIPIDIVDAPANSQFVKKVAYFLVVEDHILFCGLNCRYQTLQTYFSQLFDKDLVTQMAGIAPVVPPDILKIIVRDGVKKIDLSLTMYEASLLRENGQKDIIQQIKASLGKAWYPALKTQTKKGRQASDFRLNMSLSTNKRSEYDDLPQQSEDLFDIAKASLDDDDDLLKSITTAKGQTLSRNKLEVKETIAFEQLGKDAALDPQDAERKLYQHFSKLLKTEVIVS